jgi:O-antigen/teichoic acid export membrane protein
MTSYISKLSSYFILFGLGLILSFAAQIFSFRVLGVREYGIFSVIYNLSAIASVLGAAGFDVSALRFFETIPESMKSSYLRYTARIAGISTALICFIFLIYGIMFLDQNLIVILLGVVGCFFWSFVRIASSLLRAVGRFSLSILIDRPFRDGLIVFLCGSAIIVQQPLSVAHVTGMVVIGGVVGITVAAYALRIYFVQREGDISTPDSAWGSASLGLLLANVLQLAVSRIDVIMISYFSGPETAAILNVLAVISDLVIIPSSAILVMAMPRIALYYKNGDSVNLKNYLTKFTLANMAGGLIISVLIIFFSSRFIGLFGNGAATHVEPSYLLALVATKLAMTVFTAASPLLMMSGHVRGLIVTFVVIVIGKVVALALLVPSYALLGGVMIVIAGAIILTLTQSILALKVFFRLRHQGNYDQNSEVQMN